MKQLRNSNPTAVLANPRRDLIDDLVFIGALVGLGFIGFRLLGNRMIINAETTTLRNAGGGGLVYDSGSKSLAGVGSGDIVTDRYGNRFRVLPGGQEVVDLHSGITYSSAIFQSKYDLQE